jgi:hypothetical protein
VGWGGGADWQKIASALLATFPAENKIKLPPRDSYNGGAGNGAPRKIPSLFANLSDSGSCFYQAGEASALTMVWCEKVRECCKPLKT